MKNNNYPIWLVPLDIAIELKEIGYKEDCYFEFSKDNGLTLETLERESSIIGIDDLLFGTNECWQNISVPTWTEVFAWFKKHYYHVNIDDKGTWIHWSFYNEMIEPPILEDEPQDGWETDYYEALEALVKALIRTYKNEQL